MKLMLSDCWDVTGGFLYKSILGGKPVLGHASSLPLDAKICHVGIFLCRIDVRRDGIVQ